LRDSTFGELKVPLAWTAAVAAIVAAIIAAGLLISDRRGVAQSEAYGAARQAVDAVAVPVGEVLSAPLRWTGAGVQSVRGYFFAVSENRRLKAELKEMRQWRDVALALRDTNDRYRALLGLRTDPPIPMAAARVVSDSRGPFANARLANAGREKGVREGHPVVNENGLVGRVVGVTDGASRILLLTDVASRTPVMIDRTNARAILTGDGGPNPRLEYMRGQDPVREGDRVVTSGDGGLMPRGLPVGVAAKGLDGRWRVVLGADSSAIDYVRILLFQDFSQLVNAEQLNKMTAPPLAAGAPAPQVTTMPTATPPAALPKPAATPRPAAASRPAAQRPAPGPAPASPEATDARPAAPSPPPAAANTPPPNGMPPF